MNGNAGASVVSLLALSSLLALAPLLVVTVTSFAKVSVVLFLVRNALGIQQTPPNIVLYSIAIVLSLYVMAPVVTDTYAVFNDANAKMSTIPEMKRVAEEAVQPVRRFLDRHATMDSRSFFIESAKKVWTEPARSDVGPNDLSILVPSFLTSELKRAFEIGFLLYLPFVMIDFVVSAILMALGMQMMSPTVVSTPFKLLLFVLADGWDRLIQGLIMSYAPGV